MQTHQTPLSDRLAIPLTDARHPRHHRLARPLVYYSRSIAMASGTIAPWVDLWVRLWLAQTFLVSGLLKIGNAATVIRAGVEGGAPPKPFRYIHLGSLATIGRKAAVADFGFLRLSGTLTWWLWGLVHVSFLPPSERVSAPSAAPFLPAAARPEPSAVQPLAASSATK